MFENPAFVVDQSVPSKSHDGSRPRDRHGYRDRRDRHGSGRRRLDRRGLLIGAAALFLPGCRDSPVTPDPAVDPPNTVPLRVAWAGSRSEAEEIQNAWLRVSPQSVEVIALESAARRPDASASVPAQEPTSAQQLRNCDVAVYPVGDLHSCVAGNLVRRLSDLTLDELQQSGGREWMGLEATARWTPAKRAVFVGCKLPALLFSGTEPPQLDSWEDYDRWVDASRGRCAEPLGPGWAAMSFLWRASRTVKSTWLFERETFEPVIDSDAFIQTLDVLAGTAKRYARSDRSPHQIWDAVADGELVGGIGIPRDSSEPNTLVQIADLPNESPMRRLLVDPMTLVASITMNCRQSDAAAGFLRWISSDQAADTLTHQVPAISRCRESPLVERQAATAYQRQLQKNLSTPATLPTLAFDGFRGFYRDLDAQVIRCLGGKESPATALANVAEMWRDRNRDGNRQSRHRAWLRMTNA